MGWKNLLVHVRNYAFKHPNTHCGPLCVIEIFLIYYRRCLWTSNISGLILHPPTQIKNPHRSWKCSISWSEEDRKEVWLLNQIAQTTMILRTCGHTCTHKYIPSIMQPLQFLLQPVSSIFDAAILHHHLLEELSGASDSTPRVAACQCMILGQHHVPALTYAIFLFSLSFLSGQPMLVITMGNTLRPVILPALLFLKWRCKWDLETTTV